MARVLFAAADPAMVNFGIARLYLDLDTLDITIDDLILLRTENQAGKTVRKNSDDLRRGQELVEGFHLSLQGCACCFAEIPTGAQSARAAFGFGLAVGVLASSPVPLIQVQPFETKLATVGTKTASKEEMMEWAYERHPNAPWRTRKFKGKVVKTNDNEHIADACAIAEAGIKTQQFRQLMALWKATPAASLAQALAA
jgi:Holliday junction resolvasome RuvABC endonuclease subunit